MTTDPACARVAVVGAGPAGIRAVETLVSQGLRPTLFTEDAAEGGQIYRKQPKGFIRPYTELYASEAQKAARLHTAFTAIRDLIDFRPHTLVWNMVDRMLWSVGADGCGRVESFDHVILATGAIDRIYPFPGWTLPGVFSLGAAQVALKYQACVIGERPIFVGSGPLLYLVAWQYMRAGLSVTAVVDSASKVQRARAMLLLPSGRGILLRGLRYYAELKARGVRLLSGAVPVAAQGNGRVQELSIRVGNRTETIATDAVATGYGLKVEAQLASLAGCGFRWDEVFRQFLPDAEESTEAAVLLAGDGAMIAGADAAEASGELCAMTVIERLGQPVNRQRRSNLVARLERLRRFQRGLARIFRMPADFTSGLPNETMVCRCEGVTAGDIRRSAGPAPDFAAAKAATRVGMGRCQGRVCHLAAIEILADAANLHPSALGPYRAQPPIKPVDIGALIPKPSP